MPLDPLEEAIKLKKSLKEKIYGQKLAINAVVDSVKNKVVDSDDSPKHIFFFLGPPATASYPGGPGGEVKKSASKIKTKKISDQFYQPILQYVFSDETNFDLLELYYDSIDSVELSSKTILHFSKKSFLEILCSLMLNLFSAANSIGKPFLSKPNGNKTSNPFIRLNRANISINT